MKRSVAISLRPSADEPLYQQLFDQIADRVQSGAYPEGYRLPATRALAKQLATHRNTVVRAYEELEAAGIVSSTVGRGTFVNGLAKSRRGASEETAPSSMPWASLMSDVASAKPIGRATGFNRVVPPRGAIALSQMQPAPELLPRALLQRCIDYSLRKHCAAALTYGEKEGAVALRQQIAEDLLRQGVPARAEDIVVTTGSQQAIDLVARLLVSPGDSFLLNDNTYHGALTLLAVSRARVIGVPNDDEGPMLDALERAGRAGVKATYLMPDCQNPTGARISEARRDAIIEWSRRHHAPLIEDDYASELVLDGGRSYAPLRARDADVIYVGSYSKKLIPALRVGYILSPPALKPQLVALKHALDLGTSQILQLALAEFLARGYLRAHLKKIVPEYRRRRDVLEQALRKHLSKEARWRTPETGIALWLQVPPTIDTEQLFQEAMRSGVVISPGSLSAATPEEPRGARLTFCRESPERLVEGVKRLSKAWDAVARQGKARPRPADHV